MSMVLMAGVVAESISCPTLGQQIVTDALTRLCSLADCGVYALIRRSRSPVALDS